MPATRSIGLAAFWYLERSICINSPGFPSRPWHLEHPISEKTFLPIGRISGLVDEMEKVEVGDEVGHLFGRKLRNAGLGLGHLGQDRGPFVPHDGSDLGEALIEDLCPLAEVLSSLSAFSSDGMAFDTTLC